MMMQVTPWKYSLLFLLAILTDFYAVGQYYYTDLVSAQESQQQLKALLKSKIKKVSVTALDNDNTQIDDFVLFQEINASAKTISTFSKSNVSESSILTTEYNEKLMPKYVFDSTGGGSTRTHYQYDSQERLIKIESGSFQPEQPENSVKEERIYFYTSGLAPDSMIRIKGNRDSTKVVFIMTENKLPGEEIWYKDGNKTEHWFYYYDAQNRLTDIVRFNRSAKKMLPDYLFGYDANGLLTSRIVVQPTTGTIRIWQFQYDERGLKTEDQVKNRQRQLEGRLVYTYQ